MLAFRQADQPTGGWRAKNIIRCVTLFLGYIVAVCCLFLCHCQAYILAYHHLWCVAEFEFELQVELKFLPSFVIVSLHSNAAAAAAEAAVPLCHVKYTPCDHTAEGLE